MPKGSVPFSRRPGWLAWSGVAVAVVLLANNCPHWATTAQGDIRETPRPEAFLSGGARSEIVLREMSETLKRIDSRLERFEKALRDPEPDKSNRQPAAQTRAGGDAGERDPSGGGADENR
jgi:hypothetical protein